jgi:hypothetical protein
MRCGLGLCVVWYMVMSVLEKHSQCSSQASRRYREHVLTEHMVPTNQVTRSPNPEHYNFES